MQRELDKLQFNLAGIREMKRPPDAIFVIDPDREQIAVAEANRLKIPVVAVVDTNCDPDRIAYCVPGNDDAIRAIRLFCAAMADAAMEGAAESRERSAISEKGDGSSYGSAALYSDMAGSGAEHTFSDGSTPENQFAAGDFDTGASE
jgi:small subunit ribosomal protein S2